MRTIIKAHHKHQLTLDEDKLNKPLTKRLENYYLSSDCRLNKEAQGELSIVEKFLARTQYKLN